ncbi:hypothetical protein YC2023_079040 [Brassica napus]
MVRPSQIQARTSTPRGPPLGARRTIWYYGELDTPIAWPAVRTRVRIEAEALSTPPGQPRWLSRYELCLDLTQLKLRIHGRSGGQIKCQLIRFYKLLMKLCAAYQNYLQRKYLAWRSKLVMTVKRHQDGKVQKMRERVEIDEENKSVFVFDGDVMP